MSVLAACLVGALYAGALYTMLRRNFARIVIGLVLLSHAVHLLIFTAGGLVADRAPLVPEGSETVEPPVADPLPQALILTSIVISFGVLGFTAALIRRGADVLPADVDELQATES